MTERTNQQSGRFDATANEQASMLAQFQHTCTNGGITEAAKIRQADIPGWGFTGGETKYLWDRVHWSKIAADEVVIPTPHWTRGKVHRTDVRIPWGVVKNKDTDRIEFHPICHFPAHRSGRPANLAALRGLEKALAPIIAEYKPDVSTLGADFNRRLTSAREANLINSCVEGLGMHLVVPPKATHLLFTIDGWCTTADLHDEEMLNRKKGYDHRGATLITCGC